MTYIVVPSKKFKKALQKLREGGRKRILGATAEVLQLLAIRDNRCIFVLATRWRDHALKGDKQGIRELHLSQDDLLLYAIDKKLRIVKLLDILNHEELRKKL